MKYFTYITNLVVAFWCMIRFMAEDNPTLRVILVAVAFLLLDVGRLRTSQIEQNEKSQGK